jgi:protein SCO1/2
VTTRQLPFKLPFKLNANVIAVAAIALVAVLFVPLVLLIGNSRAAQRQITLHGTPLAGRSAPGFLLHNQNGEPVSLTVLGGHPMVLTFLDATCAQHCPNIAPALNQAAKLMGRQAVEVEWVAISTNPANTASDARAFITKNQITVPLEFLLGSRDELAPVWLAYHVQVAPTGGQPEHTAGLYVIDREGHERVWLDQGFDPKLLSDDLKALLS